MAGEKLDRIRSLNHSETEVLHELFRYPEFKVKEYAESVYKSEQAIRGNLTAIFKKLEVPDIVDKREWVIREYSDAYSTLFPGNQIAKNDPDIFIKPPDPIFALNQSNPLNKNADSDGSSDGSSEGISEGDSESNSQDEEYKEQLDPNTTSDESITISVNFFAIFIILTALLIFFTIYTSSISSDRKIVNKFLFEDNITLKQKLYGENIIPPIADFNIKPEQILVMDDFDGPISFGYELISTGKPKIENGMLYPSVPDSLQLYIGDSAGWKNYIIFSRIRTFGCEIFNESSTIGIRLNKPNFIKAFSWNSCSYLSGTTLDVVITVRGPNYKVLVNNDLVTNEIIDLGGHIEVGGVVIDLKKGSAIDYFAVVKSPD